MFLYVAFIKYIVILLSVSILKIGRGNNLGLLHLQQNIQDTLDKYLFEIIHIQNTKNHFRIVASFGGELEEATFYIDRDPKFGVTIGASISLEDGGFLADGLYSKVQSIAVEHNIVCSPIKYDEEDGSSVVSMRVMYGFSKYNENNFMLYVNNFKQCIERIYNNIKYYLRYHSSMFVDLSMFHDVDWEIFEPSLYISERDSIYGGSWNKYAEAMTENGLSEKLGCIQMCMAFELKNDIPIDCAYEFIIEQVSEYDDNDARIFNQ